jgi:hypothetical protein
MSKAKSNTLCPKCGASVPPLTFVCAYCGTSVSRQDTDKPETPPDGAGARSGSAPPADNMFARFGNSLGNMFGGGGGKGFKEPDSAEELVAFFSEHIGGVSTPSMKTEQHKRACESALAKLKVYSVHDARLAQITLGLQNQYQAACAASQRSNVKLIVIGVAALLVFFAFAGFMAYHQTTSEAQTREEIQRLIGEGKYNEARIRAQGVRSKKELLQAIDQAENSAKKEPK